MDNYKSESGICVDLIATDMNPIESWLVLQNLQRLSLGSSRNNSVNNQDRQPLTLANLLAADKMRGLFQSFLKDGWASCGDSIDIQNFISNDPVKVGAICRFQLSHQHMVAGRRIQRCQ